MFRCSRHLFFGFCTFLILDLLLAGCSADPAPIEEQTAANTNVPSESTISCETFRNLRKRVMIQQNHCKII